MTWTQWTPSRHTYKQSQKERGKKPRNFTKHTNRTTNPRRYKENDTEDNESEFNKHLQLK
jgi:hypothetical protein